MRPRKGERVPEGLQIPGRSVARGSSGHPEQSETGLVLASSGGPLSAGTNGI